MKYETGRAPSVAAVHDMSCVGRCALTVAIPALAAMGIQPIPLPTSVLSSHTGGYGKPVMSDLSGFMSECIEHWKQLELKLDAVYSGYLADVRQVELVRQLQAWQKRENGAFIVVDPVMGDGGRMYSAMPADMPRYMRQLCGEADLITPNLTEAALMCGVPYPDGPIKPCELNALLEPFEARITVLTSVTLTDDRPVNVCRIRETGEVWACAYERIPVHYPGTGDLFASVLTGEMLKGRAPQEAMARATAFLERTIRETYECGTPSREGVQLERALKHLLDETCPAPLPAVEKIC